jgi:rhodanese-related sulfurtransferase
MVEQRQMLKAISCSERMRGAVVAVGLALGAGTAFWGMDRATAAETATALFQTITPQDLAQMLTHKDFVFVNVHIPYEGEIAQTDAFIPFDQITTNLSKLPADKNAKIVLYCRSGRMSEIAATALAGLGYTRVAHLGGGMIAWQEAGQPLLHK